MEEQDNWTWIPATIIWPVGSCTVVARHGGLAVDDAHGEAVVLIHLVAGHLALAGRAGDHGSIGHVHEASGLLDAELDLVAIYTTEHRPGTLSAWRLTASRSFAIHMRRSPPATAASSSAN